MIGLLVLLVFSTASSCMPDRSKLESIPAPVLPAVIKVPVPVRFPPGATDPCAEPVEPDGGVRLESQLGAGGLAWRVTAQCNANKLKAIEEGMQP